MRERCLIIAAILLSLISVPGCAATVGSGGGTSEALYIEASRAAAAALRQRAAGRWDRASASYERAAAIARGIVQRGPDEPLARDLVAGALLLAVIGLEDIERRVLPLARIRAKAGLTLFGTALELASRAGTPTERIRLWVALARGLAAADQTVEKHRRHPPEHGELVALVLETGGRPGDETVAFVRGYGQGLPDAERSEAISTTWRRISRVLQLGGAEMVLSALG